MAQQPKQGWKSDSICHLNSAYFNLQSNREESEILSGDLELINTDVQLRQAKWFSVHLCPPSSASSFLPSLMNKKVGLHPYLYSGPCATKQVQLLLEFVKNVIKRGLWLAEVIFGSTFCHVLPQSLKSILSGAKHTEENSK